MSRRQINFPILFLFGLTFNSLNDDALIKILAIQIFLHIWSFFVSCLLILFTTWWGYLLSSGSHPTCNDNRQFSATVCGGSEASKSTRVREIVRKNCKIFIYSHCNFISIVAELLLGVCLCLVCELESQVRHSQSQSIIEFFHLLSLWLAMFFMFFCSLPLLARTKKSWENEKKFAINGWT